MTDKKKRLVRKSNALIEASYRLSVHEQRLLLSCISQIRREQKATDERLYIVTAQEIAELAETNLKIAYRDLKAAAERLFDRRVTFVGVPGEESGDYLLTRWVQSVKYRKKAGRVELRFSKHVLPYLTQLTEQFTQYALSEVGKMSSGHAIRLFEILAQWKNVGEKEFSLGKLREVMELGDSYPAIKDFKKYVLVPAIAQINTFSSLHVTWAQRKTGRQVTHLWFKLKHNASAPTKQAAAHSYSEITRQEIERSAKPGESYEQAAQRIRRERRRKPTRPVI